EGRRAINRMDADAPDRRAQSSHGIRRSNYQVAQWGQGATARSSIVTPDPSQRTSCLKAPVATARGLEKPALRLSKAPALSALDRRGLSKGMARRDEAPKKV